MSDISEDKDPEQKKANGDEKIEDAVAQSSIQKKKQLAKKKKIKRGATFGGIAVLAYIIYLLFVPYKGSMAFGICKVFLEMNVQYPEHLRYSTVEEFDMWVRIWYTQTDAYGQYRLEPIQCFFKPDERYGFILDKVTVRRREVDRKKVTEFNKTIPLIVANPPDLTLPTPLPDTLKNLRFDVNRYIRPIL